MADTRSAPGSRHRTLLTVLLLALAYVGTACDRGGEGERIRALIQEGAARAEKHRVEAVLDLATPGLRADPGRYDREQLREILAMAFYAYGRFRILYPEPAVEVAADGAKARAVVHFLVARHGASLPNLVQLTGDPADWLQAVGEHADLYHLELDLVPTAAGWRAAAARLELPERPGFLR